LNDSNEPASTEGHAEIALDTSFEEELFAEIAAVTMAIVKAIAELGSLSSDNRPYLSRILETGLCDLEEMNHRDILNEHDAAFFEKVKARYTDLITTTSAP
jgi:hypothetical protein